MTDQGQANSQRRVDWFHPGEIVAVARVPRDNRSNEALRDEMHGALRKHAAEHLVEDPATGRSFRFDAPGQDRSLVFSFHRLVEPESPKAVKGAVESLHRRIGDIGGRDIDVIGVMPHVHIRAHDTTGGPSPGTYPRPVYPDQVPNGWTHRFYQPVNPGMDLTHKVADAPLVRVAILDAHPDLQQARARGEHFKAIANNAQLLRTVEWVQEHTPADAEYERDFKALAPAVGSAQRSGVGGELPGYPIPDHGLFIAGLIHGIAPQAPISLVPALDEMGVGDLAQLLLGLQRVLRKDETEPLIINLSLGFLPHPARLPAAWYGLKRPQDPEYLHSDELFDPDRDERWVAANRPHVDRAMELLQIGLRELGTYLSLNNCLVIAAAGNDSLKQVEAGRARLEPRLPARFESVLGVAATTSDPRQPARYSNVGEERELGDHVATFGGNVTDGLEPEDGVIGVYSGEFPFQRPNETGWAFWSGTSFATGIVSGIAANFWAHKRKQHPNIHASRILADLHAEATEFGPYVSALRTPSIEVQGRWGR